MNRPEISTIMTTYQDDAIELRNAVNSILHQEGVNIELILVMVTDDINIKAVRLWVPIINKAAKFTRMKLIEVSPEDHPGRSPGGSFYQINEGLKHVTKPWVRWFSGDDLLYPRSSMKQVEALEKSGKLVSYGGFTLLDEKNTVLESVKFYPYRRETHQFTNFINDVALWSSDLLKFTPFLWERWENYSFWDLWLRIYDVHGDVFHYTDEVLWSYRIRERSEHVARLKRPGGKSDYDRQRRAFKTNHPIR
tara:strand:- start:4625 stop:5374 length:750 start_codon:yes stop_codon:yes gene_type:complete